MPQHKREGFHFTSSNFSPLEHASHCSHDRWASSFQGGFCAAVTNWVGATAAGVSFQIKVPPGKLLFPLPPQPAGPDFLQVCNFQAEGKEPSTMPKQSQQKLQADIRPQPPGVFLHGADHHLALKRRCPPEDCGSTTLQTRALRALRMHHHTAQGNDRHRSYALLSSLHCTSVAFSPCCG